MNNDDMKARLLLSQIIQQITDDINDELINENEYLKADLLLKKDIIKGMIENN